MLGIFRNQKIDILIDLKQKIIISSFKSSILKKMYYFLFHFFISYLFYLYFFIFLSPSKNIIIPEIIIISLEVICYFIVICYLMSIVSI